MDPHSDKTRLSTVPHRLQAWLQDDTPIIGVNWGTARNQNLHHVDEAHVQHQLAQAVSRLAKRYRVFLYAVWPADLKFLRRLAQEVRTLDNVLWVPKVYPASLLTFLFQHCGFIRWACTKTTWCDG